MTRTIALSAALLTGACTTADSPSPPSSAALEHYEARGQEPGWQVVIHGGRIDYTGNYGDKKISVARPDPRPSINGRRYVTPRLTVDVTYSRCNDAMSGFGFEHQVMVTADGETYDGCGGARKKEWDM
jgi:heat shock protein HslJ